MWFTKWSVPMPVEDFAEFLIRAMPAPLAKLLLKDK